MISGKQNGSSESANGAACGFFQRDVVMCFRKLLEVVQVVHHRVVKVLGEPPLEEMQKDLGPDSPN